MKSDMLPEWANEKYFKLNKRINNIDNKIGKLMKEAKPVDKLRRIQSRTKDCLDDYVKLMTTRYYENLIKDNPTQRWKIVNKIIGKGKERNNMLCLNYNDTLTYDNKLIAELFADFFESNLTAQPVSLDLKFLGPVRHECMFFEVVSYDEVFEAIMKLDCSKAAGSDGIPGRIVKELIHEIVFPVTELINKIVFSSTYPDQFKFAHVIPLHKKGVKTAVENYRGISLLPVLNKIVEGIILSRISHFIKRNNLEDSTQYGYKKGIGTQDALFKFLNEASKSLDDNDYFVVLFVDLSKAFDYVNHEALLYKLKMIGIKGFTYELLESYLKGRFFSVRNGSAISTKRKINSGVAQGGVMSPTLFNINQIDMQYLSLSSNCIKFADDLLLYKSYKKKDLLEGLDCLKDDLNKLNGYFLSNGLTINFSKTSFMVMKNSDKDVIPDIIQLDEDDNDVKLIHRVDEQKYLGIVLDNNLNFKAQHAVIIDKLMDTLKALRIIKHHIPISLLIQFFNAHFMSHVYYCSFIYAKLNKEEIKRMQVLQNRCIKCIFKLDSTHDTIDLFKSYLTKTLPIIGVIYFSLITSIKKSLIYNSDLFPRFQAINSNTRSNGLLMTQRFRRKSRLGNEASYLGVKLFNQLPTEIKQLEKLGKFKREVKKYLLVNIELLLDDAQLSTRKIA
jgi:hypothetical protein